MITDPLLYHDTKRGSLPESINKLHLRFPFGRWILEIYPQGRVAAKLFSVEQESHGSSLSVLLRGVQVEPYSGLLSFHIEFDQHAPTVCSNCWQKRSTPDSGVGREVAIRQVQGMVLRHPEPDLENREVSVRGPSRPICSTR